MCTPRNTQKYLTLLLASLLAAGIAGFGCGPRHERISYEPPPIMGDPIEVRFPETDPKEKPEDLPGSPFVPPIPAEAKVIVQGRVVDGETLKAGKVAVITFSQYNRPDGRTLNAGNTSANAKREDGAISYRRELKAPKHPGEYTLEVISANKLFYGRVNVTVVEAKQNPK